MACCKACCGCADCAEGDQGKCCCGGASGECCDVGEYCCSGACQGSPCEAECTVDEDCYYCENAALILVDPCDGTYSTDKKCCPEGSVAWVDNPGDARQGNCVDDCDPSGNIIPGAGAATLGSCCDDVCFEGFPCPP